MKEGFLYTWKQAEKEANKMQEKVESGKADNFNDAEKLIEEEKEQKRAEQLPVTKKIEIPGLGELEYTERKVLFPEKDVKETGGVKGYIRKTISWENLFKFWGVNKEEWEKIKKYGFKTKEKLLAERKFGNTHENYEEYPNTDSIKKLKKSRGLNSVVEVLTSNEFPNQTLNHIINGWGSLKGEKNEITKGRLLEKLKIDPDTFISWLTAAYEAETNKKISPIDLFKRAGVSDDLMKKYIINLHPSSSFFDYKTSRMLGKLILKNSTPEEVKELFKKEITIENMSGKKVSILNIRAENLSKNEPIRFSDYPFTIDDKREISEKSLFLNGIYFQNNYGLNLTNPGVLWTSWNQDREKGDWLYYENIILGFKPDTSNKVLGEFCKKVLPLIQKQKEINGPQREDGSLELNYEEHAEMTVKAIFNPIKEYSKEKIAAGIVGDSTEDDLSGFARIHPRLPIILNHPDIQELRWCHADYAAIPTKEGYNILEMIT